MIKDLYTLICEIVRDWLIYKQVGHAKPDHPDQKEYPIITGPSDASAHLQIDLSKTTIKAKKKK